MRLTKVIPFILLFIIYKKKVNRKECDDWKYKQIAITKCTDALKRLFESSGNIGDFTLVPIPPSKIKSNPLYDDRISQILNGLIPSFCNCDVRELLFCLKDMDPSHQAEQRPNIENLYLNYGIDEKKSDNVRNKIILFDDVLTNGTHFYAARKKLLEYFPGSEVFGCFIARRVFPEPADEFNLEKLSF